MALFILTAVRTSNPTCLGEFRSALKMQAVSLKVRDYLKVTDVDERIYLNELKRGVRVWNIFKVTNIRYSRGFL
jgi:hypothetical protein